MKGKFKRQRFRGRDYFEKESKLIFALGTKAAWLHTVEQTRHPEKWREVLEEMRPWSSNQPNLCIALHGEICLIGRVYVRIPDDLNRLTEPEVKTVIDRSKNPLIDKTEWIYLKGNEPARKTVVTFPKRRAPGMPRKKALPFE